MKEENQNGVKDFFRVIENEKSVEVQYTYPQSQEAFEALNTLVGYCQGKGLPQGDYSTDEMWDLMKIYIHQLPYDLDI